MNLPELVIRLDQALPGFANHLASKGCLFPVDSAHGVLAAFAGFTKARAASAIAWSSIADLVNDLVAAGDDLDEAVCTCLLESLASRDHPLRPLLVGEAADYWDEWL